MVLSIVVIIVIVVGGVYFYTSYGNFKLGRNTHPQLELISNVGSHEVKQGSSVKIHLEVYNDGPSIIVNRSSMWPTVGSNSHGISIGPCGTLNEPMGLAILQGDYTQQSIISSKPLLLWRPGVYMCPAIFDFYQYGFFPFNSSATLIGSSNPPVIIGTNISLNVSGFWASENPFNGSYRFISFPPGPYTVVVADEWGASMLLHFYVT